MIVKFVTTKKDLSLTKVPMYIPTHYFKCVIDERYNAINAA